MILIGSLNYCFPNSGLSNYRPDFTADQWLYLLRAGKLFPGLTNQVYLQDKTIKVLESRLENCFSLGAAKEKKGAAKQNPGPVWIVITGVAAFTLGAILGALGGG